ncbi:MAG: hypothetical protein M1830_000424 [Pleopsidium flavum]|nr:MAG: hypothetical protein M1830_000424 [Pleopsidium flavum]
MAATPSKQSWEETFNENMVDIDEELEVGKERRTGLKDQGAHTMTEVLKAAYEKRKDYNEISEQILAVEKELEGLRKR